ncbi:hypothetical protein ACIBI3_00235 [Actinomadura luteofluorescens]|uniref:hypothetical protein n=1 Tax=Actinomadura luteofluorescens TaxID=46163 RepID=UPI00346B8C83
MTRVEEAQGTAGRRGTAREAGVDAGERVAALVQRDQHICGVRAVAVSDEGPLGLVVRVERTRVVGQESGVHGVLLGHEGVPRQRLTEGSDLGVDDGQFVLAPPTEDPEHGCPSPETPSRSYRTPVPRGTLCDQLPRRSCQVQGAGAGAASSE